MVIKFIFVYNRWHYEQCKYELIEFIDQSAWEWLFHFVKFIFLFVGGTVNSVIDYTTLFCKVFSIAKFTRSGEISYFIQPTGFTHWYIAHYWLNKGYIELYENGGKIWFTSSPSCHNPNSISKLECVLTLFFVPWFLREHTHTQIAQIVWSTFLLRGDLFIFLQGYYRGY